MSHLDAPDVRPLKWSLPIDLTATGLLGAGWLVSEYGIKKQLAPAKCIWCEGNNLDRSFQTLFSPRVGPSGGSTADDASNVVWVAGGVATLGIHALLAYRDGAIREFPIDALIILETVFASMVVNQTVKFLVARERPFVGHLPADEKGTTANPDDNNLSFYSGHATFTTTLATTGWAGWSSRSRCRCRWRRGGGVNARAYNVESNPHALSLVPAPGGIGLAGRF